MGGRRRRRKKKTKKHTQRTNSNKILGPQEAVFDVLHYLMYGKRNWTAKVKEKEEEVTVNTKKDKGRKVRKKMQNTQLCLGKYGKFDCERQKVYWKLSGLRRGRKMTIERKGKKGKS